MSEKAPTLLWLRRDLRLTDHPALAAALDAGRPVIPIFIHDDSVARLGAAPKWRLGLALEALGKALKAKGSRLILRKGDAQGVLRDLIDETGAGAVHWSRLYDPEAIERDKAVKSALKEDGIDAQSHAGHLMFEPWTVETKTGGYYKVFTPMWRAVKDRDVAEPLKAPGDLNAPDSWPASDKLDDWRMGAAMDRGADIVLPYQQVGEDAAQDRLAWFMDGPINDYGTNRDKPAVDGTSCLSENLSLGEISAAQCWHAGLRKLHQGSKGAEPWLQELVWREFAYHLIYHTPQITTRNWREEWDEFPWNEDEETPEVMAWKQGRTGIRFVDAAMREMYVTGRMHNRARMIVASYLTKHLMTHWRIGQKWFDDHLTDWDIASNAMGWQWAAGSGPDATPYFRVFNPETQLDKFDKQGNYLKAWIVEGYDEPSESALSYFDAIPRSWDIGPGDDYPDPVVGLKEGRERALSAYKNRSF